jgi:hypothetical protein
VFVGSRSHFEKLMMSLKFSLAVFLKLIYCKEPEKSSRWIVGGDFQTTKMSEVEMKMKSRFSGRKNRHGPLSLPPWRLENTGDCPVIVTLQWPINRRLFLSPLCAYQHLIG